MNERIVWATVAVACAWWAGCGEKQSANDEGDEGRATDTAVENSDAVDTGEPDTGLATPFDYLQCDALAHVDTDLPEGGKQVNWGLANAWANDADAEVDISYPDVPDKPFDRFLDVTQIQVVGTPTNPWNIQVQDKNAEPIANGDVLLASVWARCEKTLAESNECQLQFIAEDPSAGYAKIVTQLLRVSKDWKQFWIPFVSDRNFDVDGANFSLFAGYADQTVQVGPVYVYNFGPDMAVEDLPQTPVTYPGMEADAAWRAEASARIDTYRKGTLVISVVDQEGNPVPGAKVEVHQKRHAFGFGSAIDSGIISSGGSAPGFDQYTQAILDNFNIVTAYNAFKWKPWAGDWGGAWNQQRAVDTLNWALENGLRFRSHVVLWPSWRHLPNYLQDLANDPEGLRAEINAHIDEALTLTKGKVEQWDLVNEPFDNHDLMDILGEEEMIAWFQRAHEVDPDVKLFLNDYAILSGGPGDTGHRQNFEHWLQLLTEADAPIHGIGLQSHFGTALTGPSDVYGLLERYAKYGLDIAITEYDIDVGDDALAACFTFDFMTAVFSHPQTTAFVMWGFQEDEADPLYDANWNLKPAGRVFRDLVFSRWWTEESVTTGTDGTAVVRGFFGDYEIAVTAGDASAAVTATLVQDGDAVTVTL